MLDLTLSERCWPLILHLRLVNSLLTRYIFPTNLALSEYVEISDLRELGRRVEQAFTYQVICRGDWVRGVWNAC